MISLTYLISILIVMIVTMTSHIIHFKNIKRRYLITHEQMSKIQLEIRDLATKNKE